MVYARHYDAGVRVVVLVLLLGGCGANRLAAANWTGLSLSSAALACDWEQTRQEAEDHWKFFRFEHNPVLGRTPSAERVNVYFFGAAVINAAIWLALPGAWRSVYGFAVAGIQTKSIAVNVDRGLAPCGIR